MKLAIFSFFLSATLVRSAPQPQTVVVLVPQNTSPTGNVYFAFKQEGSPGSTEASTPAEKNTPTPETPDELDDNDELDEEEIDMTTATPKNDRPTTPIDYLPAKENGGKVGYVY
ncbi:Hypothetical protein NTJ_14738 [Nesidiocoris tenuis]|uniref:DUF4794 domain-containing protein n=1 Tax=Nesidiocoris tenuis TaxID=355587 RepID=A0ABN7BC12_9HEMI|nr:Hypothetical protein NTJ_14738 [Nesidiocoris tenuis]